MVEAERVELSSRIANTKASTSIAGHLVLTHASPVGRLCNARSFQFIVRACRKATQDVSPHCLRLDFLRRAWRKQDGPLKSGAVTA